MMSAGPCFGKNPFPVIAGYAVRDPKPEAHSAGPDAFTDAEVREGVPGGGAKLRCRNCRQVITGPQERIAVDGSHEHTFANPGGIIYQIGCFQSAPGCVSMGQSSGEFTWFKGFSWRVALCGTCLEHLGWLYTSSARSGFHGLILSRLVEEQ